MQRLINFIFKLNRLFPTPWPAVWIWIMLANIFLGIFSPWSQVLRFIRLGGILLCLVYTRQIFRKDLLLQLTLLITFCADIILALNNIAEGGIVCFLVAQIVHTIRLSWKRLKVPIVIFSTIAMVSIIISLFLPFLSAIFVICGFYITALIANLAISWRWHIRHPKNLHAVFAVCGFSLFLCCDICTGISYLALSAVFPAFLYAPANFFAWFFYYPSQVFLSNSSTLQSTNK